MKSILPLLLLATSALADDIAIHNVTRIPGQARMLTVLFEDPAPDQTLALNKDHWSARCFLDESTPPVPLNVDSVAHQGASFAATPSAVLTFDRAVVTDCQAVEVTLLTKKFPSQKWFRPAPGAAAVPAGASGSLWSHLFAPASSKGDPDYSLSGTLALAVGSGPLYTIDGSLQHKFVRGNPTSLALSAAVKTESSPKADPDSFNWGLTLLYFPDSPFGVKSNIAGMEFDKNGNVMNEISSAGLVWTHVHDASQNGNLVYSTSFSLRAGIELGDNFKNEFTIANQPGQRGSGFIFRGVPSARFALVIPTANPKRAIRFTSSYIVRLPARDELFLETRLHTPNPVPLLETNPRHYLENNLTFKITDFFAFKFQHSYGALPPTFKFTDHQGSIGIVFQANQPH